MTFNEEGQKEEDEEGSRIRNGPMKKRVGMTRLQPNQ